MDIFTKMKLKTSTVGRSQPGDIVLIGNKLWVIVNRAQKETAKLCRSLHADSTGGFENKTIIDKTACGVVSEIDVFNPEYTKNKLIKSIKCLTDEFFESLT